MNGYNIGDEIVVTQAIGPYHVGTVLTIDQFYVNLNRQELGVLADPSWYIPWDSMELNSKLHQALL